MLKTEDFDYQLPEDRIASKPAGERSASKLLVYQPGQMRHGTFDQINDFLPASSLLVFNDSRVIPARLFFQNDTGARIEIFLLEPFGLDHSVALTAQSAVTWKCLIGNRKRWKPNSVIFNYECGIELIAKIENSVFDLVRFEWKGQVTFGQIIEKAGTIPLPPYLKRDSTEEDRVRYQTIYASNPGAVAAPTAGLHFTHSLIEKLREQGHETEYLTLHVSAGTFLPVKSENALNHKMHEESVVINRSFIDRLNNKHNHIIAVGTTSMRALESLFWFGIQLLKGEDPSRVPITQDMPYQHSGNLPGRQEILKIVLNFMDERKLTQLLISTSIFIRPGYHFGLCDGLITNFHQPRSTLLMLVCAFIGNDWKKVYEEALSNNYRFLSYGDSSILLPGKQVLD